MTSTTQSISVNPLTANHQGILKKSDIPRQRDSQQQPCFAFQNTGVSPRDPCKYVHIHTSPPRQQYNNTNINHISPARTYVPNFNSNINNNNNDTPSSPTCYNNNNYTSAPSSPARSQDPRSFSSPNNLGLARVQPSTATTE